MSPGRHNLICATFFLGTLLAHLCVVSTLLAKLANAITRFLVQMGGAESVEGVRVFDYPIGIVASWSCNFALLAVELIACGFLILWFDKNFHAKCPKCRESMERRMNWTGWTFYICPQCNCRVAYHDRSSHGG